MELVTNNPFRILGINITSTPRQIEKAISELQIYAGLGKTKNYWHDVNDGSPIERTEDQLAHAANRLEKPSSKLMNAMFWFWEGTTDPIDEMAFEQIKRGKETKALEYWKEAISKTTVDKSPSYWKNLSVLYLFLSGTGNDKNDYLLSGLSYFGPFLSTNVLSTYIDVVLGEENDVSVDQLVIDFADILVESLSSEIELGSIEMFKSLLESLKNYPSIIRDRIVEKYAKQRIIKIEKLIDDCSTKIEANEDEAATHALQLYRDSTDDLAFLLELIRKGSIQYQPIVDSIYSTMTQASITAWNENDVDEETEIYKNILIIEQIVTESPASQSVIDRATEQIGTMHEVINREKRLLPVLPLGNKLSDAREKAERVNGNQKYSVAKEFVFSIKKDLDNVRQLYSKSNDPQLRELIENVIKNCALFVNDCGVTTANLYSEYGRAIELVDMARRILLYESGGKSYTISEEFSSNLAYGRKTLTNNSSNSKGLLGFALGGGIRAIKKNTKCGCGSGLNLNECCSV